MNGGYYLIKIVVGRLSRNFSYLLVSAASLMDGDSAAADPLHSFSNFSNNNFYFTRNRNFYVSV